MKIGLFFIFMMTAAFFAEAQTWTQKLLVSERDYEAGRLISIVENVLGGFELKESAGGFSKEERIRALKLITKVYIFTDDQPRADTFMIKLLREDKEHQLNQKVDPAELYDLYRKFRSQPIFRVGLRFGANKSYPNILQTFGTGNTGEVDKVYNGVVKNSDRLPNDAGINGGAGVGFFINTSIERYLKWGIEAGLGLEFRNSQYSIDNFITAPNSNLTVVGDPGVSIYQTGVLSSSMSHQQTYLRVPFSLRYNFKYDPSGDYIKRRGDDKIKNYIPYANIGISYDYLVNAFYVKGNRSGGTDYKFNPELSLKKLDLITLNNWSLFGALGLKIRLNTNFLTIEARYDLSLYNYINAENRWSQNPLSSYDLAFVEDDLSLDLMSFSVGYIYSIYNPQKIKRFR